MTLFLIVNLSVVLWWLLMNECSNLGEKSMG